MFKELLQTSQFASLLGAVVGAATTISALFIANIIQESYKRKAKRLEIALARADEQIGKFYAPLSSLLEQLEHTAKIKDKMVADDPAHAAEIQELTYKVYFLPIHEKIAKIMETQLHLIEEEYIPPSFHDYYKHVASERVFFSLVEEMEKAVNEKRLSPEAARVKFEPFPFPKKHTPEDRRNDFQADVEAGFAKASARQEQLLRRLDRASAYD